MNDCSRFLGLITIILLYFCFSFSFALDISYDEKALTIDGERKIIISGSIHYPRSTPEMWPSLIKKAKEGGLNAIETYVFWNAHEPIYRQYDFSENLDLVRFIRAIHDEGLYAILRIGPYVCAEWNYGGFPVWLHNIPGIAFRTNNEVYENEMKIFTTLIVDMVRDEGLFASEGGPIILAQIENEYGNVMWAYRDEGKSYIHWCADLAQSFHIGVPWIMCQQSNPPQGMINTCNGWYCDGFNPSSGIPKMWTENWSGWYKGWGQKTPHRTAEDLAFAVARFFQYGGTLQNYYMYHGGTNFGRVSGGPYIATTYDYDAPLDEYGNLNQPKWGHLKQLHLLIRSMENILTHAVIRNVEYGNMMTATIFEYRGERVCFFGNANDKDDITINFENNNYTIPAWSVSILPDCYTEAYNTARVNTQTSNMVMKLNDADEYQEPYNLQWTWRSEHFEHLKFNDKKMENDYIYTGNQLMDQKFANDTSDYLWYMTSVDIDHKDPAWKNNVTLKVHTAGHVLHAFVNGKHVGSQWAKGGRYEFDFESKIKMKNGTNLISLLSVTVGLENYGDHFDEIKNGIHGPVKLMGDNNQVKDLQNSTWTYKVGIHGIDNKKLYLRKNRYDQKWKSENLPTDRMFVWYQTTFMAPLENDPVVLDLLGFGKGIAWVNGHNIGRYWPSFFADDNGCDYKCDYRGTYSSSKCLSGCDQSSQRWYHVPRSFLQDDDNLLVFFEEFGGNPTNLKIQTVTVGTICANAYEGNKLELSCQGGTISEIKFASYGNPRGSCGSFERGTCESPNTTTIIKNACVGKGSCVIDASEFTFPNNCKLVGQRLAVEAIC
ncbi:beta-galactosidase 15-like [Camellia sinensis]|uniref:beta-galactosidase 15-like n=1 Tax=Camellia sinensis TaxID=4442 RepID=UPI0010357705|nr:beta-galactosidase 15-like [Camellia sinensis]